MTNYTWELVEFPKSTKPIGCKQVFRKKLQPYGTIYKFKASLVALGCGQEEDVNYFDIYAPIVRITIVRVLFAIVANHKLIILQMDFKITFLNGDLEEEIYIKQRESYIVSRQEHKVYCKVFIWT